jgi:uncharacterized membrane protein YfcA
LFIDLLAGLVFGFTQSLTGVGVVLFGIPYFMLFGKSYFSSALEVMPISILLSLMIVYRLRNEIGRNEIIFSVIQIPFVFLGFFLITAIQSALLYILPIILIGSLFTLFHKFSFIQFPKLSLTSRNFLAIISGWAHGIASQGGAVLLLLSSIDKEDQLKKIATVAFCYLVLCLIQYVLLFNEAKILNFNYFYFIGAIIGFIIGARLYSKNIVRVGNLLLVLCVFFNIFAITKIILALL